MCPDVGQQIFTIKIFDTRRIPEDRPPERMIAKHVLHVQLLHEIFRIILDHPDFFQDDLLHLLLKYISVDRVMFGVDYPFADMKRGTDWFRAVDLPREAKEKIAFRNAEALFGIRI